MANFCKPLSTAEEASYDFGCVRNLREHLGEAAVTRISLKKMKKDLHFIGSSKKNKKTA